VSTADFVRVILSLDLMTLDYQLGTLTLVSIFFEFNILFEFEILVTVNMIMKHKLSGALIKYFSVLKYHQQVHLGITGSYWRNLSSI
jgi:hypothetical protein